MVKGRAEMIAAATTSAAPAAFAAWHRVAASRTWQRVAEGATEAACWAALLAGLPQLGAGDSAVLPAGQRPGKGKTRVLRTRP